MKIELPRKKVKATRVNPKKLIIFGKPKSGKTTCLSQLDDCLLVDLEHGSEFVDAMKIDIISVARDNDISELEALKGTIKKLNDIKKEIGKYPYKYIAIDTITKLEELVLPLAADLYRKEPMGSSWAGNDVRKLPNGAGYHYLREAFFFVINQLENLCDTLILVGHLKDKLIEKEGKEVTERGLDLTGKAASLIAADADALGYLFREGNSTMVNFAASESLIAGSRSAHLRGQVIELAVSGEDNIVKVDWSKIFVNK